MNRKAVHWWIRRIWLSAGALFMIWMAWSMQAHGVASALLQSNARVHVLADEAFIEFQPAALTPTTPGLMFVPGGLVDPVAYVPLVRAVAEAGFPAAIVKLPYRMAFTEATRAELFRRLLAQRARWSDRAVVLAGHSRGAAMSVAFAAEHAPVLSALLLIGTTHPRDHDLSGLSVPVTKVAGTLDCVADLDDSRANVARLPAHTRWVEIAGGNHAQFGFYGSQLGDCRATISREDQQRQTQAALLEMLRATVTSSPR